MYRKLNILINKNNCVTKQPKGVREIMEAFTRKFNLTER